MVCGGVPLPSSLLSLEVASLASDLPSYKIVGYTLRYTVVQLLPRTEFTMLNPKAPTWERIYYCILNVNTIVETNSQG